MHAVRFGGIVCWCACSEVWWDSVCVGGNGCGLEWLCGGCLFVCFSSVSVVAGGGWLGQLGQGTVQGDKDTVCLWGDSAGTRGNVLTRPHPHTHTPCPASH